MLSVNNWLLRSLSRQPPDRIYVPPPLVPRDQLSLLLASFPGSHAVEEEREPGTHCSHTCQVPLVTWILLHYIKINGKICSPAEKLALFPSLPTIKFLIACSVQKWGKKVWSILSHEWHHLNNVLTHAFFVLNQEWCAFRLAYVRNFSTWNGNYMKRPHASFFFRLGTPPLLCLPW